MQDGPAGGELPPPPQVLRKTQEMLASKIADSNDALGRCFEKNPAILASIELITVFSKIFVRFCLQTND